MSTTTMHFGPEWMRKPQAPLRSHAPPSPPPAANLPSATSTYSALVSALPASQNDTQDESHPFRYTKEELLRIYKESPKGGLGLEVERWEGVVREIESDPIALREMGEGEKKLFAGPLNSDLRRRQSTDYLSPLNMSSLGTDRPRLNHNPNSGTGSPLRERYPGLKRRDSNADSPTTTLPRKQSLSTLQTPGVGARGGAMPSPRVRQGFSGGFDGVLGGGETWTSRRRASEATRPGAISRDISGTDGENVEKLAAPGATHGIDKGTDRGSVNTSNQTESVSVAIESSSQVKTTEGTAQGASNVASASPPGDRPSPPTEPNDLAAVEWSYKDPSGNIQGPFRADVMQKWYDDGYFNVDLPMKRVQYDPEWITVKELKQRATTEKIFMCILRLVAPPGLAKPEASSVHPVLQQPVDQAVFSHPYQPAPIRSLRSLTLDSFNGSNPSDSPSSSIGGHFGNNSPDPLAFGGRGNGNPFMGDTAAGLGFAGGLDIGGVRRAHLQDFGQDTHRLHSPSYAVGNQGFGMNGHGFSGQFNPVQSSPWGTPHDPFNPYNNNSGYPLSASSYAAQSPFNGQPPNQITNSALNSPLYAASGPNAPVDINPLGNQFNVPTHTAEQHIYSQGYLNQYPSTPAHAGAQTAPVGESGEYQLRSDFVSSAGQRSVPVAWDAPSETLPRRPAVFGSSHPTTLNTSVPSSSSQSSPWAQTQPPAPAAQPVTVSKDASPWVLASQGVLETPWDATAELEVPATTSGELEKLVEEPTQSPVDFETTEVYDLAPSPPIPDVDAPVEPTPVPAPKSKKNKSTPAPAPAPAEAPAITPTATPVVPAQKAAWAKDEKKKGKSGGTTISLREIQDAEAKAAEARKAREEKERVNRLVASASSDSKDDNHSFTASWGLPTSQAGGRTSSFNKDAAPASPAPISPTPPVWTTSGKPAVAKKTMKEIQEEEERRKKNATKETVASTAAKRAYAEPTVKVNSSAATSASNAWVTVGSSGKTAAAVAATPRPTVASITAASASARPNGASVLRPATQAPASKPSMSPIGGKVEDFPVSPSHDFLKWLTESLKGLNSSVNVEEIISMLLSFSIDPDSVTIEIIQETIYANSTTLDGRRFATEFVAKRKADAANRKAGNGAGKAVAKPISIAEVVKATPKSSQPEWGGFKVVNKKKKNARS